MYSDFHLHSSFSYDCHMEPEDLINRAIEMGIKVMCITDHRDLNYPKKFFKQADYSLINYDEYFRTWSLFREKYKEKIDIRIGIEAGIEADTANEQKRCVESYPFDFVICSAHIVDRNYIIFQDIFDELGTKKAMDMYFERVLENVRVFTDFDVVGHLDFLARMSPDPQNYKYINHVEIIDEILKRVVLLGKGIEVNTSGCRRALNNTCPSVDILKRYRELGGEIVTLGSDAHFVKDVGSHLDFAMSNIKEAGFKYYCIFKERKAEFIKIS